MSGTSIEPSKPERDEVELPAGLRSGNPPRQRKKPERSGDQPSIGVPIWVLLLGICFIMFSVALSGFYVDQADGGKKPAENISLVSHVAPLIVSELGVALVIAYVISTFIDARIEARNEDKKAREEALANYRKIAEQEEAKRWREREVAEGVAREQRLVEDVFVGVFGIRHSPEYVKKVISINLEQNIVRQHVDMNYEIVPIPDDFADTLKIQRRRFVMLYQVVSWTFHNLSSDAIDDFPVKVALSVRHGQEVRDASKVTYAKIGEDVYLEKDITPDEEQSERKEFQWRHRIEALGELKVLIKSQLIKELSDSEVWSSLYPTTRGMTLRVSAPQPLHVGVKSYTASRLENPVARDHTGFGTWTIEGAILPCNSVVFYWRTPEDDGDPTADTGMPVQDS